MPDLAYYCDDSRHLVCVPYTVANLHRMAADLGIKRCWFHPHPRHPHYDIPKRRVAEITARCRVVTSKEIVALTRDAVGVVPKDVTSE